MNDKFSAFEVKNEKVEQLLRDIGSSIGTSIPQGMGFALLMFDYGPNGAMFYISSAQRQDMLEAMREFIRKQESEK